MNEWFDLLLNSDPGAGFTRSPQQTLFVLLLAFALGQVIGWIYMWTHRVLSYSQTFTASLVVLPVLVALMMLLMSGSMVIAFGLLAVFAVVRFRNVLKDTRDTAFVLWAIIEGMSAGTLNYSTALIGLVIVSLVMLYLQITAFGARHHYDAIVNLILRRRTRLEQSGVAGIAAAVCSPGPASIFASHPGCHSRCLVPSAVARPGQL